MDFSHWGDVELRDGLTLEEVLHILESDGDGFDDSIDDHSEADVVDVYLTPPEVNELTDEDSGDEDNGGLIDNLSGNQLSCNAEVVLTNNRRIGGDYEFSGYSKNRKRKWLKGDLTNINYDYFKATKDQFQKYANLTPTEIFEIFFDDEIIKFLIDESKKYAKSKNVPTLELTIGEMQAFIGILIISGYNILPGRKFYWDTTDDMHNTMISKCMRRDRFIQILRYFHAADNSDLNPNDKMSKLRQLMTHLKIKFAENFIPCEYLNYDESMIKYFGRHSCKQFLQGKPIRFGYKVWCLNTFYGYLLNFEVYQGKTGIMQNEKCNEIFGKCTVPLIQFLDELDENKKAYPYHIFTDNLFTSMNLLKHLKERGYNGTGTIRQNRIPKDCPLSANKQMKKKPRGTSEQIIEKNDGIQLCKWIDNSVVSMASTSYGINPLNSVKRFSRTQKKIVNVTQPVMIGVYNKYMGGTDRMDEDINKYRIQIRSKKWYWPILTWLIDAAINNSWLLYKYSHKSITKLQFRRILVQTYLMKYKTPFKSPGAAAPHSSRSTRVIADLRYDRTDHILTEIPNKKRRRCANEGCTSIVGTMCTKCQVGLCIKCNVKYHTKN